MRQPGRKSKIVCTIGPAVHSLEGIRDLIRSGMDIARLNFSHGTHADHKKSIDWIREASAELEIQVGILGDLQGPKIRTGKLLDLKSGEEVSIAGLGIFSAKVRNARTARNPRTGEAIEVPAMRVPKFRPAKALKDAVK